MAGDLQLEMKFSENSENRFRSSLEQGRFSILIETPVPDEVVDFKGVTARLTELESAVTEVAGANASLAVIDQGGRGQWHAVELAGALPEENRDRHLVYLSGADITNAEWQELVKLAAGSGIRNLLPVSGDLPANASESELRKMNFVESVEALKSLQETPGFFAGAAVNPFQYTPYTLFGQYFKLVKKINSGAQFIVTQAGWDMLKLQSLQWYMLRRTLFYPTICRVMLLTHEKVEKILEERIPGIKISRDFRRILDKERRYSKQQFEAAQYRRLELQVAGCKLLGATGVQINGAELPGKAQLVIDRIQRALEEFPTFESWLEEYNSYMASAEMAPFKNNFLLFDRVLHRGYPFDNPPAIHELGAPELSGSEKLLYGMRRFCFSHAAEQRAGHAKLLKMILAGCRGCSACRLPQLEYVCPELCPKHLANGPCGGVRADGSCEFGGTECVHARIARFAHWNNRFPELEEQVIPPGKEC